MSNNSNNNNKLYLHDYNKVLQYCKSHLRLLRTFAGVLSCPPGKNSYARHFKGKHGTLYIVGKLNKCRFKKKNMNCQFFFCQFHKRKLQNDCENDHASFNQTNEFIGYQNSTYFCEIWPEHSSDVLKQKCVGDF